MNHRTVKALAAATILAMGVAACSSSGSSSSSGTTSTSSVKQGPPLVIVDNTGQVFAQTFNPYVSTSLGVEDNMQSMTYEPLLEFNIMQPTQAPIPWLATNYAWSGGGKTLTFTIRQGVKFSDGTPMTASDVAFTFNLLIKNSTLASQAPGPTPLPVSASAPNATTAVLTFSQPEYANLFLIGSTYVLPEHIWQSQSNPATYGDANPVGTGPYELSSFSSQKVTFKQNPYYWQKSKVTVPEVIFPNYVSNTTANPSLDSGQIGYAGNDVANVASDYLSANPDGQPALVRRQQRGDTVAERHQGAAERPEGAAGGQRRDQPAAALGPGRDQLRAGGHVVERAAAADAERAARPFLQQ